jgi:hypothetical protein
MPRRDLDGPDPGPAGTVRPWLVAMALVLAVLLSSPLAQAQEESPEAEDRSAEELAAQGIASLMRALSAFIESLPQYEMPIIDENGDIIIRRKNPNRDREPGDQPNDPEIDSTST